MMMMIIIIIIIIMKYKNKKGKRKRFRCPTVSYLIDREATWRRPWSALAAAEAWCRSGPP